jgi:hypothetical protein
VTALLVPVQLDALVVRDAAQPWALTQLAEPRPRKGDRRRQTLTPQPFQQLKPGRPTGAYLHWALPDALTRSVRDPATGRPRFRPVPDRWLLVRLSGPATPRAVRAWLIPDVNAAAPVPIDPLSGQPIPAPGPSPELPLTAAGPGDLTWAGYFDNVRNRLALYDPLTGVAPGPLAYLVCGWYTDPARDPVRAATQTASVLALADLGWRYAQQGGAFPDSSVYFGTAVSIGWPDPHWAGDGGTLGGETDLRPAPGAIAAGVGETAAEAVAAVTAPGADPVLARLVEGMLTGALDHLDRPDGPARLDTDLHARRFGARPSEHQDEWIWQPEAPGRRADGATDAGFRKVRSSQPRVWHGLAPQIVLSAAGRAFRHGGDGRFTATGELECRLEGTVLTAFGVAGANPGRGAAVLPADPLGNAAAYGIPRAVPTLLVELACLDPGSAPDLALATAGQPSPVAAARARWWAARDPDVPPGQPTAGAYLEGILPAPVAVTPPSVPWIPMHLEWSAAYLPSPRRAHDWDLLDLDYALPAEYAVPPADPAHPLSGRIPLSAAPTAVAGAGADLLSGAFADLTAQLRKDPAGVVVRPIDGSAPVEEPPQGARPAGFVAFRAGFLRLDRLRLVDGYGRFLDLLPGLVPQTGPGVDAPGNPGLVALKPRFTAPARVLLRYAAADGAERDADTGVSPLCGFVAPSPLDGTLEFFDAEGARLGRLRPDRVSGTAWEEDPGQPASYGALPSRWIPNRFLGGVADALLAADTAAAGLPVPTALESLVRVMDATRWSVDATGRAGDEHLALLLASPVAVLRATLLVDVQDPRDPGENLRTAVAVKLGTLAHQQDGLLAYTVADDLSRIRVVDPAVAGVTDLSPSFVDTTGVFHAYPGTPVPLLLFVVPQADVHVTTGLLPQKAVGMLREWTAPALAKLSPALRYGPVLREAAVTRLPVPGDVRGTWTWHRRPDPAAWAADEVVPSTVDAVLGDAPVLAGDGWLSVSLIPDTLYTETAVRVRISHIRTTGDHLLAVGGHNADGTPFLLPVQQAARFQESGRFAFYVQQPGYDRREAHVVHREGTRYLRTTPDPHLENNLMHLPQAPADW